MKVTTQKVKDKNKVVLDIEVGPEVVRKKFDEVYEKIGKEAKIPGFRPGNAPRHILEQHHASTARQEVLKSLIAQTYQETIKQENIDVIDIPEISEVNLGVDILRYRAQVEVKPQVSVKQYKGLKLKKEQPKVEAADIEGALQEIKKARPQDFSDERLARSLGYKTKEEFLDCLEKQLYLKKENDERARLERELIEQLIKTSSLQVPRSLVENRLRELKEEISYRLRSQGAEEDKIKERLEAFEANLKAQAEEQVRVFLILEAIAKIENIKIDERMSGRVIEFLFAEAEWS